MRLIPKNQTAWSPLVLRSDATSTSRPMHVEKVKRVAHPGYLLVNVRGKIIEVPLVKSEVRSSKKDTRTTKQKESDNKYYTWKHNKLKMEKAEEETATALGQFAERVISPAHIARNIYDATQGKGVESFVEGNEGLGNETLNLVGDFIIPTVAYKAVSEGANIVNRARTAASNAARKVSVPYDLYKTIEETAPAVELPFISYGSAKKPLIQTNFPEKVTFNYTGPQHSVKEILKLDGTVDLNKLAQILNEARLYIGGLDIKTRPENPKWHKTDKTTYEHTELSVNRAAEANYNLDQLVAVALHDFGKPWAGEGHGPIGANIVKQIFPDITEEQLTAIAEHMSGHPGTAMGKAVKGADIVEPNEFRDATIASQTSEDPIVEEIIEEVPEVSNLDLLNLAKDGDLDAIAHLKAFGMSPQEQLTTAKFEPRTPVELLEEHVQGEDALFEISDFLLDNLDLIELGRSNPNVYVSPEDIEYARNIYDLPKEAVPDKFLEDYLFAKKLSVLYGSDIKLTKLPENYLEKMTPLNVRESGEISAYDGGDGYIYKKSHYPTTYDSTITYLAASQLGKNSLGELTTPTEFMGYIEEGGNKVAIFRQKKLDNVIGEVFDNAGGEYNPEASLFLTKATLNYRKLLPIAEDNLFEINIPINDNTILTASDLLLGNVGNLGSRLSFFDPEAGDILDVNTGLEVGTKGKSYYPYHPAKPIDWMNPNIFKVGVPTIVAGSTLSPYISKLKIGGRLIPKGQEGLIATAADLVTDFIPGLYEAKSAIETINAVRAGLLGEAALNALGTIPGVGEVGKLFKKSKKIQKVLKKLSKAVTIREGEIAAKQVDLKTIVDAGIKDIPRTKKAGTLNKNEIRKFLTSIHKEYLLVPKNKTKVSELLSLAESAMSKTITGEELSEKESEFMKRLYRDLDGLLRPTTAEKTEDELELRNILNQIIRHGNIKFEQNRKKYENALGSVKVDLGNGRTTTSRYLEVLDLDGDIKKRIGYFTDGHHTKEVKTYIDTLIDRWKKGAPVSEIIEMAEGKTGYGKELAFLSKITHRLLFTNGGYTSIPLKGGGFAIFGPDNGFLLAVKPTEGLGLKFYDLASPDYVAHLDMLNNPRFGEDVFYRIMRERDPKEFLDFTMDETGRNIVEISRKESEILPIVNPPELKNVYKSGGNIVTPKF